MEKRHKNGGVVSMKAKVYEKRFSNAMCAMIVGLLLFVFISPAMCVSIDNFVITSTSNTAGVISAYAIQTNTTNFTSLNITLPKGFVVDTPQAGDLIAEVDIYWDHPTPYYGYVNFTANTTSPTTKMDIYANIGGGIATLKGMTTDYSEGAITSIKSPFGSQQERANLTLPTASVGGSLKMFSLPDNITNITVSVGSFVQNPAIAGSYVFTAEGVDEIVHIFIVPVESTETKTIDGDGTMTDTCTGGDVTIAGTGNHTITTAKYTTNPAGTPTFQSTGNYWDVYIGNVTQVTSLRVGFYPVSQGDTIYYWEDTTANWQPCSNQVYDSEIITVTITDSTNPTLVNLVGEEFGHGSPSETTQYETISFDVAKTNISMMIMGLALIPIISILSILVLVIYKHEEVDWRIILGLFVSIGIASSLLLIFFVIVVVIQTV